MIVIAHFVLTTLVTGHLFPVDGLFLQYKSSLNKKSISIQGIQNEQLLRLPRGIRKLLSNKKNLVILHRKDKKVKKFLQRLYNVVEDHSETPEVLKEENEPKDNCYRAFGGIYNVKANSKCKGRKPTIKVLKVNVIPVKKPFIDSTRKGSDDDTSSDDGETSKIIRIENVNARRDDGNDNNYEPHSTEEVKTQKIREHRFSIAKQRFSAGTPKQVRSSEENVLIGKTPKRFKVVKNEHKSKHTKYVNYKNKDKSEDDSDEETHQQKPRKQTKKVHTTLAKDESADDDDSGEPWQKPQTQKQKSKNHQKDVRSDNSDSGDWQSQMKETNKPKHNRQKHIADSSVESQNSLEEILTSQKKSKKRKREKNASKKYVYLQGPRLVNSELESEETRRADRDMDTFLPKNKMWTSHETHHLGYYWYDGPQSHFEKS